VKPRFHPGAITERDQGGDHETAGMSRLAVVQNDCSSRADQADLRHEVIRPPSDELLDLV
jgi:hypothetical protein